MAGALTVTMPRLSRRKRFRVYLISKLWVLLGGGWG
jgi:hypothetical protein